MKLKNRIALYISILFSAIFGLLSLFIFLQFASFRKEEFRERLQEKALTSIKLLIEVQEIDKQLLRTIDQNTINRLYNEKTIIFDDNQQLIYSSIDDAVVDWSPQDLSILKERGTFYKTQGEYDVLGYFYDSNNRDYYAIILAEDKYGNRKLQYLKYLLIVAFFVSLILVWFISFRVIGSLLSPLDVFLRKIKKITENSLTERLRETDSKDEINLLAGAFNQMMSRIESSYKQQQEFTAHASHELRTPVARLLAQVENLETSARHSPEITEYLQRIKADANQMTELTHSLLLLSRAGEKMAAMELMRLDEVVFNAMAQAKKSLSDFDMHFSLIENGQEDYQLELRCNEKLLEIAFLNVLRNAYQYSTDKKVWVEIEQRQGGALVVRFKNHGELLSERDQVNLFQPFVRGSNAQNKPGSGLGLRIADRILSHHNATISYREEPPNVICFEVVFELSDLNSTASRV